MRIVRQAVHLNAYRIAFTFDDGATKVVDLLPHLTGEIFVPLRDQKFFVNFHVDADTDTVTWPNGADFSPDWLYEVGTDAPSLSSSGAS